jgi:hypothetical protein
MFQRLIVQTFLLDLATLLVSITEPPPFCYAVELRKLPLQQIRKLLDNEAPCNGFSFFARPSSLLIMSWMAVRRTDSSVGVVIASS